MIWKVQFPKFLCNISPPRFPDPLRRLRRFPFFRVEVARSARVIQIKNSVENVCFLRNFCYVLILCLINSVSLSFRWNIPALPTFKCFWLYVWPQLVTTYANNRWKKGFGKRFWFSLRNHFIFLCISDFKKGEWLSPIILLILFISEANAILLSACLLL